MDDGNEGAGSTKTVTITKARVEEKFVVDEVIDVEEPWADVFSDDIKQAFEMLKAEIGKIGFYTDTIFRNIMDGYEKSDESLECGVGLLLTDPTYKTRLEKK